MLSILLLVLKIIGIIVLSIIGLVLLAVLIALFVPLRYKGFFDKKADGGDFKAGLNISFLLHIISVWAKYEDGIDISIKLFGIKIKSHRNRDASDIQIEDEKDNDNVSQVPSSDDYVIDWNNNDEAVESEVGNISDNKEQSVDTIIDDAIADTVEKDNNCKEKINIFEKIQATIDKISGVIRKGELTAERIADKINRTKLKIESISAMVNDKCNKNAVALIWKQVKRLIKAVAPRRIRGQVHFGFDDPALTGQILMYLAIISPVLPRKVKVLPEFEESLFDGNLYFKGRIFGITVISALIRLWFNKDVRRLIKVLKKND